MGDAGFVPQHDVEIATVSEHLCHLETAACAQTASSCAEAALGWQPTPMST